MCACYVCLLCLCLVEFSCLQFPRKIWNLITHKNVSWNASRNPLSISTLFSNFQRVFFIITVISTVSPFPKIHAYQVVLAVPSPPQDQSRKWLLPHCIHPQYCDIHSWMDVSYKVRISIQDIIDWTSMRLNHIDRISKRRSIKYCSGGSICPESDILLITCLNI